MLRGAVTKTALKMHFQAPSPLSKMCFEYQGIKFNGKKVKSLKKKQSSPSRARKMIFCDLNFVVLFIAGIFKSFLQTKKSYGDFFGYLSFLVVFNSSFHYMYEPITAQLILMNWFRYNFVLCCDWSGTNTDQSSLRKHQSPGPFAGCAKMCENWSPRTGEWKELASPQGPIYFGEKRKEERKK